MVIIVGVVVVGRYELLLAFAGKPGRSLCQYVTLHLHLAQLAPQFNEFLALSHR